MAESKKTKKHALDDETRDRLIEMVAKGEQPAIIAREIKISEKSALRFARFADIHGIEELRRVPTLNDEEVTLSPRKLSAMVEFAFCYKMPQYFLELLFKTRSTLLGDCMEIRKVIGHALMDNPKIARLPASVNMEYLEAYIKEHNDGKSMAQMREEYEASLKESEASAEYINIKDATDFRRYTRCAKEDIAKLVQQYRQQGFTKAKIASLIGQTSHTVTRYLNFIDIHGYDEALRCPNLLDPNPLSKYDRACVVEFMIAYHYPVDAAAVLFKADKKQLDNTYNQRLKYNAPLRGAVIARIPDTADMNLVTELISSYNKGKSIDELQKEYEKNLSSSRNKEQEDMMRDRLAGSKDEAQENKDKETQEAEHESIVTGALAKIGVLKQMDEELTTPESALESQYDNPEFVSMLETLNACVDGVSVEEYLTSSSHSGRPKRVNVLDPAFKALPDNVKLSNYARLADDLLALIVGGNASLELARNMSTMSEYDRKSSSAELRVKTYNKLVEEHPHLKRTVLLSVLGIDQGAAHYYNSRQQNNTELSRMDKAKLYSSRILELYTEFNGALTITDIKRLLKERFEISVSLNTIKSIIASLGLKLREQDIPNRL